MRDRDELPLGGNWPSSSGQYTHATERARDIAEGPGMPDEIPELGLKGWVWAERGYTP